MGYSKLQERDLEQLGSLFEQISSLEDGAVLRLRGLQEEEKTSLRYKIYNWLHHTELKPLYKISSETPFELHIKRKGAFKGMTLEKEVASGGPLVDSLLKEMLLCGRKEEAIEIALSAEKRGEISSPELGLLISRYQKVME